MTEIVTIATNLISNVGFPIACVFAMFWMMDREKQAHKEEVQKFTESINNNTDAIEKLISKLDGGVIKIG